MELNFLNDFWEINIIVLFFVIKYFEVLNKLFFSYFLLQNFGLFLCTVWYTRSPFQENTSNSWDIPW